MKVQVKVLDARLGNEWPMPTYATSGSAGLDLRACVAETTVIEPGQTVLVKTGLAIYIQDTNFAGLVLPRPFKKRKFSAVESGKMFKSY